LRFTAQDLTSSRIRTPVESHALHEHGTTIQVYQLQGNLTFSSTEAIVREVIERSGALEYLILDFKRVLSVNESACRLFYQLLDKLTARHKPVLFTHGERIQLLRHYMRTKLGDRYQECFRSFADNDFALEWCENQLLDAVLPQRALERAASPEEFELLKELQRYELNVVIPLLSRRHFRKGDAIIKSGDEAGEMFFLVRGSVSVLLNLSGARQRRLATFSAGMVFGEMALLDGAPRSATIAADSVVECDVLTRVDFDRLGASHPAIRIKLLEQLALNLCRRLRKANKELSLLES
jgi:glutaminase